MLYLVTALPCEAKPLIEYFKLTKMTHIHLPFPVFVNKSNDIYLVISGIGKVKAAIATTFLYSLASDQTGCFLNIGIAGSLEYQIGDCVIANKVTEFSTQRHWYPYVSLLKKTKQTVLMTHDVPVLSFPATGMVDMEGSAVFQAASMFVSQEQIQIIKIISDNDLVSQKQINEMSVSTLIQKNIKNIIAIAEYLMDLSSSEKNLCQFPIDFEKFLSTWHFTFSQQIQLKEFLRRWGVHCQDVSAFEYCKDEKNAKAVIDKIMNKLDAEFSGLS